MMKIIVVLIILFPSVCSAEVSGYLFSGKYLSQNQTDLEGRNITYKAGVYLEIKSRWPTLFIKEETLIRDIVNSDSFPKQINYTMGIKYKWESLEIIMTHKCLHPVDGISGGAKSKDYDYIEGRFNF
ncbi:hypothetical protein KAR91_76315 [Candidatus Pacearchaeota archaeon]|nr:hypothetical protein [Candidatus Pacearchaeota archaeon]